MLGNREDGEEALQQTFLRAHRALSDGRAAGQVRPWLFAIARNRCRTLLAARRDAPVRRTTRAGLRRPRRATSAAAPTCASWSPTSAGSRRTSAGARARRAGRPQPPRDRRGDRVRAGEGQGAGVPGADDAGRRPRGARDVVRRDPRPARERPRRRAAPRPAAPPPAPVRAVLSYRLLVARQRAGLAAILPVAPSAGLKAAMLGGAAATTAGGGAAAGGAAAGGGAAITSGGGAIATGAVAVKTLTAKVVIGAVVAGAGVTGAAVVEDHEPSPARAEAPAADRSPAAAGLGPSSDHADAQADEHRLVVAGRGDERVATQIGAGAVPGAGLEHTVAGDRLALRQRRVARLVRTGRRQRRHTSRAGIRRRARVVRGGRRAVRRVRDPAPRGGRRRRCRDRGRRGGHPTGDDPPPASPDAAAGAGCHLHARAGVDSRADGHARAGAVAGR